MLSDEDRARIQAEEEYRARVRASITNQSPPAPTPRRKVNPWGIVVLAAVLLGAAYYGLQLLPGGIPRGTPRSAELSVLSTSDNLALTAYFILTDSQGREIASDGEVELTITGNSIGSDFVPTTRRLHYDFFRVKASDFIKTERGMGSLRRPAIIYPVGRIEVTGDRDTLTGDATLRFKSASGTVTARGTVFLPR